MVPSVLAKYSRCRISPLGFERTLCHITGEGLMSLSKFVVAALAMSVSLTALGAGAHDDDHGHGATAGKPGKVSDVGRTINVEMHDNYYEPESIQVKPGETLRFVVSNKGNLVHEFNIGTPDTCLLYTSDAADDLL